jgi:prevent-host-death family protein
LEEEVAVKIVNSREARTKWRDLLDDIFSGDSDVIIERNGKPIAAMIPAADYRELQDELDDLRAARRAAIAYEDWKRNPEGSIPWDEMRANLVTEGLLDE